MIRITGAQGQKIVALAVSVYVGLVLFQPSWAAASLLPDERLGGAMGVGMALLSIFGAALVFGTPWLAAVLFGLAAAIGIFVGNTSAILTNLDMWGFLLLVPTGLAALAAWEESQDPDSSDE